MVGLFLALDLSIVFATLASAWLWWLAGRRHVRRVTRDEDLDAADINRLVIALNRTQILNSRAALATACAAVLAAIRVALNALVAA